MYPLIKKVITRTVSIPPSTEYSSYFSTIEKAYANNPQLFKQLHASLDKFIIEYEGVLLFDTNYDNAILLMNTLLDNNIHIIFDIIYTDRKYGRTPTFEQLHEPLITEILSFADYIGPLIHNTIETHKKKDRQATITLKSFKETIIKKSIKKALMLVDWITKWSSYLQREETFDPSKLKAYKQSEIILVDFGFNIGGEFGGRHYAVILEKNNNPKAGVILIAPISSYDPLKNQKAHPVNVDLGMGAIHNYPKGCQVVINQIRYISKLRIEKPKTSLEPKLYMDKLKFQEVLHKFQKRITL